MAEQHDLHLTHTELYDIKLICDKVGLEIVVCGVDLADSFATAKKVLDERDTDCRNTLQQ